MLRGSTGVRLNVTLKKKAFEIHHQADIFLKRQSNIVTLRAGPHKAFLDDTSNQMDKRDFGLLSRSLVRLKSHIQLIFFNSTTTRRRT